MDFFMLISLIRKVNIITDDSYQVMPELNSISTGIHHHELTFTIPVLNSSIPKVSSWNGATGIEFL